MREQLLSQPNISPEYLDKINPLAEKVLKFAEGIIDESRESLEQKNKAKRILKTPEFIEWATNRGQELFASQDENFDTIKYNLADEFAKKVLMWPEQTIH